MPFPSIIAQNQTVSTIVLTELGVEIPGSGQVTLSDTLRRSEVLEDEDLLAAVDVGNIILQIDGVALTAQQSSNYIAPSVSSIPSLSNYAGSADPTVNEDASQGYNVGSRWVNTLTPAEFVCVDATVGAAVWVSVSGSGGGGAFPGSSTDNALVRFDGVGGSTVQNSSMTLSDGGDASLPGLYQIAGVRANDATTAYTSSSGQTFGVGPATISLDATTVTASLYTLAAGVLTVNVTGRFWVSYEVSLRGTTPSRSQVQSWLEVDTVEVGGTRGEMYLRNVDYGATSAANVVLDLTSGEGLRLRAERTTGATTSSVIQNGSRLTIMRLT